MTNNTEHMDAFNDENVALGLVASGSPVRETTAIVTLHLSDISGE